MSASFSRFEHFLTKIQNPKWLPECSLSVTVFPAQDGDGEGVRGGYRQGHPGVPLKAAQTIRSRLSR